MRPRLKNPFCHVRDFIVENPSQLNMGSWVGKNECGTTMCIAGCIMTGAGVPLEFFSQNTSTLIFNLLVEVLRHNGYPKLSPCMLQSIIHMDEDTAMDYVRVLAQYEETGEMEELPYHYTRDYPDPFVALGVR